VTGGSRFRHCLPERGEVRRCRHEVGDPFERVQVESAAADCLPVSLEFLRERSRGLLLEMGDPFQREGSSLPSVEVSGTSPHRRECRAGR
jgi:hypothetical protein